MKRVSFDMWDANAIGADKRKAVKGRRIGQYGVCDGFHVFEVVHIPSGRRAYRAESQENCIAFADRIHRERPTFLAGLEFGEEPRSEHAEDVAALEALRYAHVEEWDAAHPRPASETPKCVVCGDPPVPGDTLCGKCD